jgi:rhamnose utilization protein RhaD (predicted bifunctional aldolase and dehydrogenase)
VQIQAQSEIEALVGLSARLGRDPLMVQASSGNTSIKVDGVLWIKASGKWLAHAAHEETFIPLDLAEVRACLQQDLDFSGHFTSRTGCSLRASIETAMHALLPHRVVVHVHSVNAIAWAVRQDAAERLAERLAGLPWQWIPYVPSGLPLGRAVERAMVAAPDTKLFVLGNHGLVVCGDDCDTTEALLAEMDRRVAITPRAAPAWDRSLEAEIHGSPQWSLPEVDDFHALATDAACCKILKQGILYPCQAVFLGTRIPVLPGCCSFPKAAEQFSERFSGEYDQSPFWIVEGRGLVITERMTRTQRAVLGGLAQVLQRVEAPGPIHYLTDPEVISLLNADAYGYRQCVERNAAGSAA